MYLSIPKFYLKQYNTKVKQRKEQIKTWQFKFLKIAGCFRKKILYIIIILYVSEKYEKGKIFRI